MTQELQGKMLDGVEALAEALNVQHKAAVEKAEADHAYRLAKAKAYTSYATDGNKRTVDHLQAMVDLACEKEMLRIRLAEANHEATIERVRSLRTEISAFQSILSTYREEAAAVRYGQGAGA
jgi:hypothetical protein